MCGIHFAINSDKAPNNVDDFIYDAFIANQVRGLHSSGLFQVTPIGKIISVKEACTASEFVGMQQARNAINAATNCPLTVGHVRHATAGKVNRQNAHPFIINRDDGSQLVGVHNGTLKDWRYKDLGDKFDVDSEWALRLIARDGVEAFKYFDGAFAFVWHDTREPDSVYMARNAERPLHFMRSADGKTILGASELGMLGWLAERNRFKIEKETAKSTGMYYLAPDKVYRFSTKNVGEYDSVDQPKYDASTGVYKAPENFHSQGSSSGRSRDFYDEFDWGSGGRGYPQSNASYRMAPYTPEERIAVYKKALQEARDERIGFVSNKDDETPVGKSIDPNLEEDIKKALVKWNNEKEPKERSPGEMKMFKELLEYPVYLSDPKMLYATQKEQDDAKDMQIYGQVVMNSMEIHEEETQMLLGEFDIMDTETGVIFRLYSEMRFADSATKYAYIDNDKPVAIVGYRKGRHGDERFATALVAPLSPKQLELVENTLLSRRSRSKKSVH